MNNRKKIITLGVASVTAFLAALFARDFVAGGQRPEPVRKVVQQPVSATDVLVVARDVKLGERLKPAILEWRKWPKSMMLPGMVSRGAQPDAIQQFAGARARVPMVAGEPVLERKIMKKGKGGLLSSLLPKGMRAIAIKISQTSGAGGFILPNDRVDVLLTRRVGGQTITDTVLSNVRVLAINQIYVAKESEQASVKGVRTATLEVTPEQAKVLARVQSVGELSLALRSMAELENVSAEEVRPELAPQFSKNMGGSVRVFRFGVPSSQAVVN